MQYAACQSVFFARRGPVASFDSDYSGGEGASIYFFLSVCGLSSVFPRMRLRGVASGILLIWWVQAPMKVADGRFGWRMGSVRERTGFTYWFGWPCIGSRGF